MGKQQDVFSDILKDDISEASERVVALTFDDGPKIGKTEALLKMLKEKNVQATFFLIGAQAEAEPELVKRMCIEGHQIGMHTYTHVDLGSMNEAEQRKEIEDTQKVLENISGKTQFLLRPPFGRINDTLEAWVPCPMILWSIDTRDWTGRDGGEIVLDVCEHIKDGDIILMHDISENGLEAAAGIIDELKWMGYTFLTIDQLFELKKIPLEDGKVYHNAR